MQCANPSCQAESVYFRSGSLHWVDDPVTSGSAKMGGQLHLIWLCAECSNSYEVQIWRPAGEQIRQRCGHVISIDRQRVTEKSPKESQIPAS